MVLIFGFGCVLPIHVRGVTLFGCGLEVSRPPVLCASRSCNALGLMGASDMGCLRVGHFRDNTNERALSLMRFGLLARWETTLLPVTKIEKFAQIRTWAIGWRVFVRISFSMVSCVTRSILFPK